MNSKKRLASLAVIGGLLFGGAIIAPVVSAPTAAHADTKGPTTKVRVSSNCVRWDTRYTRTVCINLHPGSSGNPCWYWKSTMHCGGTF